jgi:predicted phage terminase large subunit-like protein
VSRRLPAWFIGRFPALNGVVATYNDDFAADFGKDVRNIIKTPQFRQVFPNVGLQRGGAASDRLQTMQGGQWSFVGRGGSLTGRGAHLLIIDDLIKDDKEAQSQAIRDQAWNWFTKVAMSRRMGKKLVIMTFTRWHADDPIGRLTDPENPNYNRALAEKIKIINLPAIAEDDDPLGRKPGEPLWPDGPDSFDLGFLHEQQALDPLGFAALYQQRPSLLDGDMFKRENIRFYKPTELPADLRVYCASDHAVATGQRNDFTVLLKVGVDPQSNIYLLDCVWAKIKSDVAVERMLDLARGQHKPLLWWAEKGHISKSIGPFLRKRMTETGTYINIREVTPVADKATRAQSIAGRVAMGKVFFPQSAVWTEKAINEMMAFPNGVHDDFVDTLAHIGLGLQSQFAPTSTSAKKKDDLPTFGTLAWVKLADKWSSEQKAIKQAGGF